MLSLDAAITLLGVQPDLIGRQFFQSDDGLLENITATWRPEHDFHDGTVSNDNYNEFLCRHSGKGISLYNTNRVSKKFRNYNPNL